MNGTPTPVIETPLALAQKRIVNAAMEQTLTPSGVAISAYINGLMQSARLSGLIDVYLAEPPSADRAHVLEAAITRAMHLAADKLEAAQSVILPAAGHA